MQHKEVYLDNASTSKINPEIYETYVKLLKDDFYNVDALYDNATKINRMMETSREAIANLLNTKKESIIFTSGASEANNMAIKGIAFANPTKKHLITSKVEHSSVFNAFKELEELFGYNVTYLNVDNEGKINLDELENALSENTALVSIMYVNNETGTIEPIDEIKKLVKTKSHAFMHVDATQALGKIDIDLTDIDLCSFSAHKIEGLKGSGILVKKSHVDLVPLISGGQQENGLRGGTSNALVNIMFAKTLRLALMNKDKYHDCLANLHNYLITRLKEIDNLIINSPNDGVNNIVNFSLPDITSEVLMNALNNKGICVSARSTCSSKNDKPSRVLEAMHIDDSRLDKSIRVSFSYHNTKEDIDYLIDCIKESEKAYATI